MKVYYAHHMWKYGTKIEQFELELIEKRFPGATIINPATDIDQTLKDEGAIMALCLEAVRTSDAVVFSHLSGVVGMGVMKELEEAAGHYIPVYGIMGSRVEQIDPDKVSFRRLQHTGHRSVFAELIYQ